MEFPWERRNGGGEERKEMGREWNSRGRDGTEGGRKRKEKGREWNSRGRDGTERGGEKEDGTGIKFPQKGRNSL